MRQSVKDVHCTLVLPSLNQCNSAIGLSSRYLCRIVLDSQLCFHGCGRHPIHRVHQEGQGMQNFDYGVLIMGSRFGGSVTALRAREKGDRLGL